MQVHRCREKSAFARPNKTFRAINITASSYLIGWETRFQYLCICRIFGDVSSVAIGASCRSWLVKQDHFAFHLLLQSMAGAACYVLMSTLEREDSFLVIEQGRFPLARVVAGSAVVFAIGKLVAMGILVALVACLRSLAEIHMLQGAFQRRRLVALDAIDGSVRSEQRKSSRAVIKLG